MTNTEPTSEPAVNSSTGTTKRTRRRHLVIADDSAEMRHFIRDAVGAQFDDVIEVADGRALFWALLRSSFTTLDNTAPELVLITDVAMPAYDGLQVLDAWRETEQGVPTIVITAFPSETVQARAQALGVILLAKPFSVAKLRQLVREVFTVVGHQEPTSGGKPG